MFCILILIKTFLSLSLAEETSEGIIKLSKKTCQRIIITHKSSDNVAYKAGIDVKGKEVLPADVKPENTYDLGKNSQIPLEISLKDLLPNFLAAPIEARNYSNAVVNVSKAFVGKVEVKNNNVYINDQLVGDEVTHRLEELCRKHFPDL